MSRTWMRRPMRVAIILAMFLMCVPAFAQMGGLTGKCTGPGGVPLAGYKIQLERYEMKSVMTTKTNKKGEYTYIGLIPANYKITLINPDGTPMHAEQRHVSPGDPTECNFDMAAAQKEAEKTQSANPEYQKEVEAQKQSTSLKQVFDEGRVLYNQQHYAEAAAVFEKALPLAKDRNVPIVLSQLAETWSKAASIETNADTRKQDEAKALDYYNKVLAIVPNDPGVHNNLGHLYAEMGKTTEAIAEFQKAADLDPTRASGYYYNLGAILVNKGQMDDAATALKKATDLDPNNGIAWYWYGMALMGKAGVKPDGSISPVPGTVEAFQTYLKLEPNGKYVAQAQDSLNALQSKADLEYKKKK